MLAIPLLQLLHRHAGKIIFNEVPTLLIGHTIGTEKHRKQLNLFLENAFISIQNQITITVGCRQLFQPIRIVDAYMDTRRTAPCHNPAWKAG